MRFNLVKGPTTISFTADSQGRLLRFTGARLARAEENKNRDEITPAGIDELAATVAGSAIDIEHEDRALCGIFTDGRGVDDPELGRVLDVDGLVHADRFPEIAAGMQDGTLALSIEADGKTATCSICKQVFASSDQYCTHLQNKMKSGARRTVEGLTCLGGGIVKYPAGNGTDFSKSNIRFVASHAEPDADDRGGPSDNDADDLQAGWLQEELPKGQTRGDLDDSDFADPTNRKFPYKVHGKISQRGWMAAWSAAHGSHTGESNKAAIAKLKRDKPAGVNISESETLSLEALMKNCPYCNHTLTAAVDACPNCGKGLTLVAMSTDLGAALAGLTKLGTEKTTLEQAVADLNAKQTTITASLEEAKTQLTAAQTLAASQTEKLRRAAVGARMTDEVWGTKKAHILAMSDEAFAVMLELAPAPAAKPDKPAPAGLRIEGDEHATEEKKVFEFEL
jgi:hypothetical protein